MINTIFSYNEHGLSAEIFFQPLFFLGENVKQNTEKVSNPAQAKNPSLERFLAKRTQYKQ